MCLGYLCEDLVIVQEELVFVKQAGSCRFAESEEGTNIGDDIANNILTAATGLGLPAPAACHGAFVRVRTFQVVQGMRDTEPQTKLEAFQREA